MTIWDSFKLDGQRALVTGGSRGLGLEMARALGEAGAELVLVGRDADALGRGRARTQNHVREVDLASARRSLRAGQGRGHVPASAR